MNILLFLLTAILAYCIGSFSPGILYAKKKANIDIRQHGSKSTGATNVLRVLGMKASGFVFVLDVLKAVLACAIGKLLLYSVNPALALYGGIVGGLFVVVGHNWPVYYGFKGGKGVACSVGLMLFLFPLHGLISIVLCLIVIAATRYVSLGSMCMLISFALGIAISYCYEPLLVAWAALLAVLNVFQHRSNIQRLLTGKENKLGKKKF
ncbi:MAG: glycerol-3-phosphate 1-O-acyltransferase PlsY [Eubacteriales bacterium]|nr:glycerol-3-phosphate 1-O-acyltransferase PlsY [Eubacteriales bacterium]